MLKLCYKKVIYETGRIFASKRRKQYNLLKEEAEALDWLSNNGDLVIKRVDKGGAVCGKGAEIGISKRPCDNYGIVSIISS